jgi:hypothetical protein
MGLATYNGDNGATIKVGWTNPSPEDAHEKRCLVPTGMTLQAESLQDIDGISCGA